MFTITYSYQGREYSSAKEAFSKLKEDMYNHIGNSVKAQVAKALEPLQEEMEKEKGTIKITILSDTVRIVPEGFSDELCKKIGDLLQPEAK